MAVDASSSSQADADGGATAEDFLSSLLSVSPSSLATLFKQSPQLQSTLSSLLISSSPLSRDHEHEKLRPQLHAVFSHLSSSANPILTPTLLQSYAYSFQSRNQYLVSSTVTQALENNPDLLQEIERVGPEILVEILGKWRSRILKGKGKSSSVGSAGKGKGKSTGSSSVPTNQDEDPKNESELDRLTREVTFGLSLGTSNKTLASIYACAEDVLESISALYEALKVIRPGSTADRFEESDNGFGINSGQQGGDDGPEMRKWLLVKIQLLETSSYLLNSGFILPLNETGDIEEKKGFINELETVLRPILDGFRNKSQAVGGEEGWVPLISGNLVQDLEFYFSIVAELRKGLKGLRLGGDLVDEIELVSEGVSEGVGGLELLKKMLREEDSQLSSIEREPEEEEEPIDQMDLKTTQVLDIFPNLSSYFIKSALLHPRFNGDTESLIAALLEGVDLPADLERLRSSGNVDEADGLGLGVEEDFEFREVVEEPPRYERRNVFDDEKLSNDMLRRGKQIQPDLLKNHYLTDEMKASIILRAEAESSDSEDEEDGGVNTEAFINEDDDEVSGTKEIGVRDAGAEEEDDKAEERIENPPQANTQPLADPFTPQIRTILELAYIQDSTIFARDSTTRRSKARLELRKKTGLADEQLEGWRSMLERNPKKDKILQKHDAAFAPNRNVEQANRPDQQDQSRDGLRERTNDSGRGGRGRGHHDSRGGRGGDRGARGRGGRGDGGRAAHQRRQRGNDRKLAKVA